MRYALNWMFASPPFICWKLSPIVIIVRGGALGWRWGHEGGVPTMGSVPLSQRPHSAPSPLLPCEDTGRSRSAVSQKRGALQTDSSGVFILDSQPPEMWTWMSAVDKPPLLWYSIMAAQIRQDRVFVFCCSCNKLPQIKWLKAMRICSLTVLEVRVWNGSPWAKNEVVVRVAFLPGDDTRECIFFRLLEAACIPRLPAPSSAFKARNHQQHLSHVASLLPLSSTGKDLVITSGPSRNSGSSPHIRVNWLANLIPSAPESYLHIHKFQGLGPEHPWGPFFCPPCGNRGQIKDTIVE